MAAALVIGALGPAIEVVKWVAKPIIRQFNYLCCFTTNINNLKDEAQNLDDALSGLEGEIERARDDVQEPVAEVKTWLTKSKKIKGEINEIVIEAPKVESGCLKIGARFSLSKKAKKTTDRTKEHRGGKKFDVKFLSGPPAARREAKLRETYEFVSRNKIEEDIMTTLRGGDEYIIGICGMGGLGKTTMARKLMNRALHESVFQEVVIATVSENVDISKIQDEIGGQLGLEKLKDEKSESARSTILHSRLTGTKRILLVLDDIWKTLELEDFGIPRGSKGCTILFTSRNLDVLNQLRVQNIFGMDVLSVEEAWPFFKERVGTCVEDRGLNPIAKQVAKECGGLPINLATVAAGLKDEDNVSSWEDALRQLSHSDQDIPELIAGVYNSLKLSYDRLRSEQAKSMFLLFCLFHEDADVPLEYLTHFCMGLDIYKGMENLKEARNRTHVLIKMLKSRSLLLESDKGDCVRMHDVVRDVCTFIAKENGYIGKDGCTWISSSHLVRQRSALLSCPKLRLLFLDSTYDSSGFRFDDEFMEGMRELCVLSIESCGGLTSFPRTTHSLINLKSLRLDSCWRLKSISVVGMLRNLEILICHNCGLIEELPSEMKGLNWLKLLDLTWCEKLQSIGRGIISSLVGLEELKMHKSFDKWEGEDKEERENAGAQLRELEALTNLTCLQIDIDDPSLVMEDMPLFSKKIVSFIIRTREEFSSYEYFPSGFSKAMNLFNFERETRFGDWIEMQLLRDTECLYLKGGANNVDLAKSQNIRWLKLEKCESMKNVVRTVSDDATVFPFIELLMLDDLPELQELCDGPISSTSFQHLNALRLYHLRALTQFWKNSLYVPNLANLSSIYIYGCDSLRNLGQLSMPGKDCLPHLQQLRIERCEMMEQVFLWNDGEEAGENKTSIWNTKVFPNLKEVKLYRLSNLTSFYQGIQGIEFPLLTKLEIEDCPDWKNIIIGSSSADIHDDDSRLVLNKKVSFGSLEILNICGGSMSFFTLPTAANLKELYISNCDEMIKVIEDEQQQERNILVFPKLKILHLKDLPKLVSFCNWKSEVEFPVLGKVDIKRCPNMESFSLGVVATPDLESFATDLTTYAGVGVNVAFNSLKALEITENENPFDHHKISVSLFSGLEKLMFSYFQGSVSLFPSSVVGSLFNLKILHIESSDEIVKVIEDEDEKMLSGGEITSVVIFPKLEELYLSELPNLVRFCEWKYDVELPSLTNLDIARCPIMEKFSMGYVAAPNLKIVKIDRDEIEATKDLNGALQLHHLEKIFRYGTLQINHNPFYGHEIPPSVLNRLEELKINKYEGSTSLFTLSVAANLVSLAKLFIEDCDEMLTVIEDELQQERILVFPKLEELYLRNLPKLVTFCDSKCEVELPILGEVEIKSCPNMESFSLGLVATPSLESFETDLSTYVGVGVDVAFNSLKELGINQNENAFDHHRISVSLFNGLEVLFLYKYKGSLSFFQSSAIGSLVNLRVLAIAKCDEIVNVMEDEEEDEDEKAVSGGEIRSVVFPKLEELYLTCLPNLVRFCEWKCDIELPSLTKVLIWDCPNMENFSIRFVAAPNLKIVEIDEEEVGATEDFNGLLQQHYLARR